MSGTLPPTKLSAGAIVCQVAELWCKSFTVFGGKENRHVVCQHADWGLILARVLQHGLLFLGLTWADPRSAFSRKHAQGGKCRARVR